jgi:hypothetical protein
MARRSRRSNQVSVRNERTYLVSNPPGSRPALRSEPRTRPAPVRTCFRRHGQADRMPSSSSCVAPGLALSVTPAGFKQDRIAREPPLSIEVGSRCAAQHSHPHLDHPRGGSGTWNPRRRTTAHEAPAGISCHGGSARQSGWILSPRAATDGVGVRRTTLEQAPQFAANPLGSRFTTDLAPRRLPERR